METAIERKRRLRRERILQNSESRMQRILGESASATAASKSCLPTDVETDTSPVDPAPVTSEPNKEPSTNGASYSSCAMPRDYGRDEMDGNDAAANHNGPEVNGFHPELQERAKELDSHSDDVACATAPQPTTLETGAFGFDASKLKKRDGNKLPKRDAIVVQDEEELKQAKDLLLRDYISGTDVHKPERPNGVPHSALDGDAPPKMRRVNAANKRQSKEDALRNELERLMNQERITQPQSSTKSSSRTNSTRRKTTSSMWYTKTWFRTTFAILLALFVRVLMQINLSDHFSDSAFYPFFSMELSFFVAAFCSKPPGYRIPIGGGIVEMVTNLLGISREILGNLKWFYEFAFQKPVEEFALYFFVFALSHLVLKHVEERDSLIHDEL